MDNSLTKRLGSNTGRTIVRPKDKQLEIVYTILLQYPEVVLNPKYPHPVWSEISASTVNYGPLRTDSQWYRTWYDKKPVIENLISQIQLNPRLEEQLKNEEKMAVNLVKEARAFQILHPQSHHHIQNKPVLQRRPAKKIKYAPKPSEFPNILIHSRKTNCTDTDRKATSKKRLNKEPTPYYVKRKNMIASKKGEKENVLPENIAVSEDSEMSAEADEANTLPVLAVEDPGTSAKVEGAEKALPGLANWKVDSSEIQETSEKAEGELENTIPGARLITKAFSYEMATSQDCQAIGSRLLSHECLLNTTPELTVEVDSFKNQQTSAKEKKHRHEEINGIDFLLDDHEDDRAIIFALLKDDDGNYIGSSDGSANDVILDSKGVTYQLVNEENFSLDDNCTYIFTLLPDNEHYSRTTTTKTPIKEDTDEEILISDDDDDETTAQLKELIKLQKQHHSNMEQIAIIGFHMLNTNVERAIKQGFKNSEE